MDLICTGAKQGETCVQFALVLKKGRHWPGLHWKIDMGPVCTKVKKWGNGFGLH